MDKSSSRARGRLPGTAALRWIGAAVHQARPPESGAHDAAPAGYLYVPCTRIRYHGASAQTQSWVQEVPIVRKTAKWIYYASDSWDRIEAVVSPGRVSRQEFETGTRCRAAGVIPIPGTHPGSPGRLFFATRQGAEGYLHRAERERAGQAVRAAPGVKELRRAMADAHPDRGGTAEQFIEARRRYQKALRSVPAVSVPG